MGADQGFRPIRELPAEVARKIAAGEVIDRPAAVIRELLDNSIDAGSTKITVEIEGGGIERIRVIDDGCGMTADDLSICTHTHTTSKIASEDDLLSLTSLGFRGEALSSIAAVSRLEITTTRDGREAWRLDGGKVIPARLARGTTVDIGGLFENFPARRQFLKRASAETGLCRQIFTEKALAWPAIEFRFSSDGKSVEILPQAATLRDRCLAALAPRESESFFYEIAGAGEGFRFSAVLGSPDVVRPDRRQLMVFVNGRRIMEYSLLQALEYGAEGHFPNGGHPFGCLFVDINPALVDFNIHPAKREARFRDPSALHHAVSSTVRDFFRRYTIAELRRDAFHSPSGVASPTSTESPGLFHTRQAIPERGPWSGEASSSAARSRPYQSAYPSWREDSVARSRQEGSKQEVSLAERTAEYRDTPQNFRFLGQALGTFLVAEKNGALYLIDQHAAHERILYDELLAHSGERQELLVPYRIETDSASDNDRLSRMTEGLRGAGFTIENEGEGIWQVTAVPTRWAGTKKDLVDDLLNPATEPESIMSRLYATAACRAACKDGDVLDPITARNLAERAFTLAEPVCPHGRPIWIAIDRDELFQRIKRT